ncbi:MAG: uroporphyrinogen-III synthase, partial [Actinobacteria bacterium]|nr:uroporphyrinogen-III synthase [Actinomycetota bacterium]NIU70997.1 uroporphyrinogen-III synthase [Actinomycetota bacterium]NIW32944.1 uroporphyrinogen-III synthase [Actinomycetota bacterium]NIX25097.1 uroporphyrinogen-III synthase [Actinomycetota bacterium]
MRGQAVVLDGQFIAVPSGPLAVLRALARRPGQVLSAAEIRTGEPAWAEVDDHAVEMAVSRLRSLLPGADLVQTI